ncbi:hypothetical protein [Thermomonas fusca]
MSTTPLEADFTAGHGRDVPEDAGLYRTQLESPVRGSPGDRPGQLRFAHVGTQLEAMPCGRRELEQRAGLDHAGRLRERRLWVHCGA